MMQEIKAFNEKRAEIYWWLSSLFAKELTQKELDKYQSMEIRAFLTGLAENDSLRPSIDDFVDALNRLVDRQDAQLELSADFCDLFLKTAKHGALPYASIYLTKDGLLNGEPAQKMDAWLQKHGVQVNQQLNEPADHLAIMLDFLGNLIIRSNELEQERHMEEAFVEQNDFLQEMLLSWLPSFAVRAKKCDEFGFYSSAIKLLVAFCKLDSDYLVG
ncbi:TPA: molecular chaperone TorD [Vibrio vulnificus]|nr:molecular chaperone TorD [Vibrio vulnificus]